MYEKEIKITANGKEYVLQEDGQKVVETLEQALIISKYFVEKQGYEFTSRLEDLEKIELMNLVIKASYYNEKLRLLDEIRKAINEASNKELNSVLGFLE